MADKKSKARGLLAPDRWLLTACFGRWQRTPLRVSAVAAAGVRGHRSHRAGSLLPLLPRLHPPLAPVSTAYKVAR
eukprot:2278948-Rhodomonas_salina.1